MIGLRLKAPHPRGVRHTRVVTPGFAEIEYPPRRGRVGRIQEPLQLSRIRVQLRSRRSDAEREGIPDAEHPVSQGWISGCDLSFAARLEADVLNPTEALKTYLKQDERFDAQERDHAEPAAHPGHASRPRLSRPF